MTNLAVARGATCLFTRVSPFGIEGDRPEARRAAALSLEHARQWLVHVGLEKPVETIEGDTETISAARDSLAEGAARLVDELRLSLEFYAAQEGAVPDSRTSSSAAPESQSPDSPSVSSATSVSGSSLAGRSLSCTWTRRRRPD